MTKNAPFSGAFFIGLKPEDRCSLSFRLKAEVIQVSKIASGSPLPILLSLESEGEVWK